MFRGRRRIMASMTSRSQEARFLALLEEHRRILYKVANAYCRDGSERADLLQEMLGQLWRGFDRYDEKVRFTTWMYRVALNVAISFYRSEGRRIRNAEPIDDMANQLAAAPIDEWASEELKLLRQLIGDLEPMERALITLYLDGNCHTVIAEIVGISVSNVGTRIGRIKERLQRNFDAAQRGDAT